VTICNTLGIEPLDLFQPPSDRTRPLGRPRSRRPSAP
jgi:hypothetical protein